jgi:predicted transcriptional regulator
MPTDLEQLIEMGFNKDYAELAVKQSGGLQGAIDWLDKNQDRPLDEINAEQQGSAEEAEPAMKPGEEPKSLVCDDCGKKFKSVTSAEFHASKS